MDLSLSQSRPAWAAMVVKQCDQIWAIYWTLGNISKPDATISLPKSLTLAGNFSKGVKIFNFSSEIIFGNFYTHLATFYWSHFCRMIRLFAFQSMNSFNFYCLKNCFKDRRKGKEA